MFDSVIKGAGNLIGGALNTLAGPMGTVIDGAGKALGLPPVVTNAIKTAAGVATGNVMLAAGGAYGLAQELSRNPPAKTEYVPQKDDKVACEGYAKPEPRARPAREERTCAPPTAQPSGGGSRLDPKLLDYHDALRTIDLNFRYLDGMDGKLDGSLSLKDLERIAGDGRVSPELRQAARFLVENRGYFEQLETSIDPSGSMGSWLKNGRDDDRVSLGNLQAELRRVQADFALHGRPVRPGTPPPQGTPPPGTGRPPVSTRPPAGSTPPAEGGCDGPGAGRPGRGSGANVRDILQDPTLSIEDKIQMLLMSLMQNMDEEILQTMDDLAAAQDKRAGIKNEKGNEKKLADADRNLEFIQARLQKLIEKRKLMFELMSNMSTKFHEMARTAISNLGRA
jgi:hypothetical protein